ncbi:MAG: tellurite resistance TerB family protein [Hyphomicrobium sp.]
MPAESSFLTPQEALIYAMITTSAVDRKISDNELQRIGSIVRNLPVFETYDHDWLVREAQDCGKILSKTGGLDRVLALIDASLPEHLRETAYVLSAEVAAADLEIKAEERRFLELLAAELEIDQLTSAALDRAARARHRKV